MQESKNRATSRELYMKRWSVSGVSCLLAGILATAPAAFGQAVSQISGNVKDQAGAVLPGVEITATRTNTGLVRTTVSNETGNYVRPNLPLGPYKLEAALAGFRTFVQTGIFLQVDRLRAAMGTLPATDRNQRSDFRLRYGSLSER